MTQILVFGDSIVWGAEDLEGGGWADRFKLWFKKTGKFNEVFNLGNPGDNSEWLLERMNIECAARIEEKNRERDIIIIQIGMNDSTAGKNDAMTTPENFGSNIEKIIRLAQKYSSRAVFVGLTPANEAKTNPVSWNANVHYKNNRLKRYNEIIKSVCAKNKIRFVDICGEFVKTDYKKLLEDGLHPNSEGHEKIFGIVRDFLVKEKII